MNAMADPLEAPEFLDVQMHQLAGHRPLIALHGGRGRPRDPRQPQAALHVDDRGQRQLEIPRNPQRAPAPLPPPRDLAPPMAGQRARGAMRPARAIRELRLALRLVPPPPPPSAGSRRHPRRTVVVLRSIAAASSRPRAPAANRCTMCRRPNGVNRASLCMFAEPSSEWVGGFATPSFTCYGSVNNLLINYS